MQLHIRVFFALSILMSLAAFHPSFAATAPIFPYLDFGVCPYEGCSYNTDVVAKEATDAFQKPDVNSSVAFRVQKGDFLYSLTGVVIISKPRILEVIKPCLITEGVNANKGNRIYILSYLGEGIVKAWINDKTVEMEGDGPVGCTKVVTEGQENEWWIKVNSPTGKLGWVRGQSFYTYDEFGGGQFYPEAKWLVVRRGENKLGYGLANDNRVVHNNAPVSLSLPDSTIRVLIAAGKPKLIAACWNNVIPNGLPREVEMANPRENCNIFVDIGSEYTSIKDIHPRVLPYIDQDYAIIYQDVIAPAQLYHLTSGKLSLLSLKTGDSTVIDINLAGKGEKQFLDMQSLTHESGEFFLNAYVGCAKESTACDMRYTRAYRMKFSPENLNPIVLAKNAIIVSDTPSKYPMATISQQSKQFLDPGVTTSPIEAISNIEQHTADAQAIPKLVQVAILTSDMCYHWGGEVGDQTPERNRQIDAGIARDCPDAKLKVMEAYRLFPNNRYLSLPLLKLNDMGYLDLSSFEKKKLCEQGAPLLRSGFNEFDQECFKSYCPQQTPLEGTIAADINILPSYQTANSSPLSNIPKYSPRNPYKEFDEFAFGLSSSLTVYELFDKLKKMYGIVKTAEAINGVDYLLLHISEWQYVGAKLSATDLKVIKSHLEAKSFAMAGSVLAHFILDKQYDVWESKGSNIPIDREVAQSLLDTAINLATVDVKGQIFDQSIAVLKSYAELSQQNTDYFNNAIKYASLSVNTLSGKEKNYQSIINGLIFVNNGYVKDVAKQSSWINDFDSEAKVFLLNNILQLRAKQVSDKNLTSESVESIKAIAANIDKIADVTLTDLHITKGYYHDFANNVAASLGVVGW